MAELAPGYWCEKFDMDMIKSRIHYHHSFGSLSKGCLTKHGNFFLLLLLFVLESRYERNRT
jgi:hypothetical protein